MFCEGKIFSNYKVAIKRTSWSLVMLSQIKISFHIKKIWKHDLLPVSPSFGVSSEFLTGVFADFLTGGSVESLIVVSAESLTGVSAESLTGVSAEVSSGVSRDSSFTSFIGFSFGSLFISGAWAGFIISLDKFKVISTASSFSLTNSDSSFWFFNASFEDLFCFTFAESESFLDLGSDSDLDSDLDSGSGSGSGSGSDSGSVSGSGFWDSMLVSSDSGSDSSSVTDSGSDSGSKSVSDSGLDSGSVLDGVLFSEFSILLLWDTSLCSLFSRLAGL